VDKLVDATYPRYAIDEEYLTREKLDALCAGE
jgi:hypothetical protein